MVTETETLSLPTTTASTDVAPSTACLPCEAQTHRRGELDAADWDTDIASGLRLLMPDSRAGFPGAARHSPAPAPPPESGDAASDGGAARSVEESCKRALHHFPSPDVAFPMPALEFDFRIAVRLNPEPSRVETRAKEVATVCAGRWFRVLWQWARYGTRGLASPDPEADDSAQAGGYDLGQARGFRPIRIVEGAFVLQTTDESPAILEMRTRGSLSGPCGVLDVLLSPQQPKDIDPRQYGFRMFATLKTPDKRYAEIVNCSLWVASGVWHADELIIDAYRVT